MSARTPEQLAEDREASDLATALFNTIVCLGKSNTVAVNAAAGLLGLMVSVTAQPGQEAAVMRAMARQARDQMDLQLRLRALGQTVGNA
ncbi:MAG: hypothetical protein K5Q68_14920 [Roseococcus sp.]|nr:hypothetical protein [Roseococcus sp.]